MALSIDRLMPKRSRTTETDNTSRSQVVLSNAPQLSKILQDVVECVQSLKKGFEEDGSPIDDNDQTLQRFCAKLEYLLQADMKDKKSITGRKKDYWEYFCECLAPVKGVNDGIKYVKTTGDYKTSLGKGRAFLRFCLVHHRLADSIQQCCVNGKVTSGWYHPKSIWLQHDKSSFLIGALYDFNDLIFDLAPRGYDLDSSWPSFARKTDGLQSWTLSERARTMSISSLNSIGQETPSKNDSSHDMQDYDNLVQELAISENTCSDMKDKIEALEQQKGTFQQSLAESRGEMNVLETQLEKLQKEHKELLASHRELEKTYDQLKLESEYKDKDGKSQETAYEFKLTELKSQNDIYSEKLRHLEEDLQLSQENLQITRGEREDWKVMCNELENKIKDLRVEFEDERQHFQENKQKMDEERKALETKIQTLEDSNGEICSREETLKNDLQSCNMVLNDLERRVTSFNKGFQWVRKIMEGCNFQQIEDLDTQEALLLKDLSYLVDGFKEKLKAATQEKENLRGQVESASSELAGHREETSQIKDKLVAMETLVFKLQENEKSLKEKNAWLENENSTQTEMHNKEKEECNKKEKDILDAKSEIRHLQAEIERMKDTLSQKVREIDTLKQENMRYDTDLQKTNEFYNMATKGQSDLLERLSSQEQIIKEKSDKLTEIFEKEKMFADEKYAFERKNESLERKVSDLSKACNKLEEEQIRSNHLKEEMIKELGVYKEKVTELEMKNTDLTRKVQDCEKEMTAQNLIISDKDNKAKQLITYQELKVKEYENMLQCEKDKVVEMSQDLNMSKNENLQKENEIRTFEQKQALLESTVSSMKDHETKLIEKYESTERMLNEKALALLSLEKDFEVKLKEEYHLKDERDTLKSELKGFQDQFYEKQSEVLLLQEKLVRSEEELERTKEFYTKASKNESDLSSRFGVLESSLQVKDKRIMELTQNEKIQAVEISKLTRDLEDAGRSKERQQSDINHLRKDVEEKETQIEGLKLEIGNLHIKRESLERKFDDLALDATEYSKKYSEMVDKYDEVVSQNGELKNDVKNLKIKEKETSKENRILEQKVFEMDQTEKQLYQTIDQMKVEFNIAVQEKERLELRIEDLEKSSNNNQAEIEKLKCHLEDVMKEKSEANTELFEKSKTISELQDNLNKLHQEYDAISKEKFNLEEDNEEVERCLQKMRDEYGAITTKYDVLCQEKLTLLDNLKKFEDSESFQISEISRLQKTECEIKENNMVLTDELNKTKLSNNELQRQVADFENQLEEIYNKDSEKSAVIQHLKEEISDKEKKNQKLSDEILVFQEKESNNVEAIKKLEESIKKAELEKESIHGNMSIKCVEMSELQARYDDFQSENSCLVQEYDLLQQSFNDLKITEEVVRAKLSEMTLERDELSTDLTGIKELLKSLEVQLHEASVEKMNLLKNIDTLSSQVDTLQTDLADMLKSRTDTEIQYEASCREYEKLSVRISDLEHNQSLKIDEIENLSREVQKLENDISVRDKAIVELKGESESLREESATAVIEIKGLEAKLEEKESIVERLECSLSDKNKLVQEQEQKLRCLQETADDYSEVVKKCEDLRTQVDNLLEEKQALVALNEQKQIELMMTLNDMKMEKQALLLKNEEEEKQTAELERACKQYAQSKRNFQDEIKQLETEKEELTKKYESEKQHLKKSLEGLSLDKTTLTHENENFQKQILDLEGQFSEFTERSAFLEKEKLKQESLNEELFGKLTKYEKELHELQEKLDTEVSMKADCDEKLIQCSNDLELEKEKCKEAAKEHETTLKNLISSNTQLENILLQKENLEKMIETLNENVLLKIQELNDLNLDLQESNSKVSNLSCKNKQLETLLNESETVKEKLKQEIGKLKNIESEKKVVDLNYLTSQQEIDMLSKTVDDLQREISDKSAKHDMAINDTIAEIEAYITEISNLKDELNTKNSSLENFSHQIQKDKDELEIQTQLNQSLTAELNEIRQEKDCLNDEMKSKAMEYETDMKVLKENNEHLQSSKEELVSQLADLNKQIERLSIENKELGTKFECKKSEFDLQTKELDVLKSKLENIEMQMKTLENEQEQKAQDSEAEVDSLRQEIAALEFQLSSKQMDDEKQQSSAIEEEEFRDLKDKLMEQETLVEQLQQEMAELRKIAQSHKEQEIQIQNIELQLESKDEENTILKENLSKLEEELTLQASKSILVKSTLTDEKAHAEEKIREKDAEINQLKEDLEEMKKKLVKLIREKDSLWQKTDQLSYQQKLQASERWMDDSKVTNCLGCNAEFSFTLRKHHCRLCGRIFCNNCSSNYVQAAHSSKKSRACTSCFVRYTTALDESTASLETDIEQSVELPKRHILGQKLPESVTSSTNSDLDTSVNESMMSSSSQPLLFEPGPTAQQSMTSGQLDVFTASLEVAAVGGNETDEDKLKDTASTNVLSDERGDNGEDRFHMISDEEVQRSLTMSGDQEVSMPDDPNMTCSMYINTEELQSGEVNSQNEVWIKPGKLFAVPVIIRQSDSLFGWEFTSYPKDVVFSVTYRSSEYVKFSDSQPIVPPCKCDSHKQVTKGELTTKQSGVYTLVFDNTYSRMTSKRVNYTLLTDREDT